MNKLFEVSRPHVAVNGTDTLFPVHRIYCVGQNYSAHAREMGGDPDREPPFYFMKPADAVIASGSSVPYPPRSTLFTLAPGDLLFTGTPAGVGPVAPGDRIAGGIEGVCEISVDIAG